MKHIFKKLSSAAASLAMTCSLAALLPGGSIAASAASDYWKFDFGNGGVASGYTGVSASTGYDAGRGYGFSSGTSVADVGASGSGALSDAVQFKNASATGKYTFCADVPNGLYQVSVWLGNTNRTSIGIENMLQIVNMTGNGAYHTLQVPVTDGQLNICAFPGKEGYAYSISALEIKRISETAVTNPTIWVCGDSTVCNYYPLNSSSQAGWAQMLPQFIDTNQWQVMNMAASGQWARGFMEAGQFDVIEKNGQPGDIYVISIGINDTNSKNNTTEEQYEAIITDMAKRAMAKGMRVILVKQQGRNGDCQRNPLLTGRWYGGALDRVGAALNIEVVDLFNLWQDYCLTKTADEVSAMYLSDGLHPNRAGATVLAQFMADAINAGGSGPAGEIFEDGKVVMFRNLESGMYLSVEDGIAADGTNVSQSSGMLPTESNTWKLKAAAEEGEYYIYSMLDNGNTYLLDVDSAKTENGTNIGIWSNTKSNAQIFKLIKDGSYYHIATSVTKFRSYVGIWGGSHEEKGNAIEWQNDGTDNQKWMLQFPQDASEGPLLQADMDGDGKVTAKDLTLMKRTNAQTAYNLKQAADLNGDLKADAEDAALLQDYLTARTDSFADPKFAATEQMYVDGWKEETNAGYQYLDYLNLDNTTKSEVTFTVNVPQEGNYLCSFNIANGSANDRRMKITVNSRKEIWYQSFLTTSAWTTWEERALVLPLAAGINFITLHSDTAEGGPNFDYLKLTFTDEPIAEPYDPSQNQQGTVSDKPVVYVAADSTAQSYKESYAPQQGWGYYLQDYFSDNVTIANHAIAGRSSKSFYDNGRLATILDSIKPGDYLLVDFGINDGASSQPERYAPVCNNVDNPAVGSFEYYMTFYIKGALEKGATPILMSPTLSIKNATQPFSAGYRNIDSACSALARKYNIPYFDLGGAMAADFNKRNYNTVKSYYMGGYNGGTDFTHFTDTGAKVVANIITQGIRNLNIDLSQYVK
ncbi:MAG: GDSL-type esterase/lipase family protein [Oscillospiraceae bacterium]|nr:GDSL-type esterase/lipase family protein [Oscillospiraceae bacterium]